MLTDDRLRCQVDKLVSFAKSSFHSLPSNREFVLLGVFLSFFLCNPSRFQSFPFVFLFLYVWHRNPCCCCWVKTETPWWFVCPPGLEMNTNTAAAVASLEEGNNEQLDALYDKVQQLKHLSLQIDQDLDNDSDVLRVVDTKIEGTQNNLLATLDNLSDMAKSRNMGAIRLGGLLCTAMVLLYLALTVRL